MNWIKINDTNINLDNVVTITLDSHLRRADGEYIISFKEIDGKTNVVFRTEKERNEVYERILKSLYL